jgi:hypothetical protein
MLVVMVLNHPGHTECMLYLTLWMGLILCSCCEHSEGGATLQVNGVCEPWWSWYDVPDVYQTDFLI